MKSHDRQEGPKRSHSHPTRHTTTNHAFGPALENVNSLKSGRTSTRIASMDLTVQPLAKVRPTSGDERFRGWFDS